MNYRKGLDRLFSVISIPTSILNAVNASIFTINELKHSTRSCEVQLFLLMLMFLVGFFSTYFLIKMSGKILVWLIDGFIEKS